MADRHGRQTPTTSVVLPYLQTQGKEAVELYNRTRRNAYEWQQLQIYDIMAQNPDGLWTHTRYGLAVPRRNGKNEVVVMRELWGLKNGEHILHTAHLTDTAHDAWERLYDACRVNEIKDGVIVKQRCQRKYFCRISRRQCACSVIKLIDAVFHTIGIHERTDLHDIT